MASKNNFLLLLRHASLAFCVCLVFMVLVAFMPPSQYRPNEEFVPVRRRRMQSKADIAALRIAADEGMEPKSPRGPRRPVTEKQERLARIPEYNKELDLLFFSHIHKTSGTSLSKLLGRLFGPEAVVPSSHPSMGLNKAGLMGHDDEWWKPYRVMYAHNRPNVTELIKVPNTKRPRLLLVVRNPVLHKASIYFESVCRYGRHIKDGVIDQKEATEARITGPRSEFYSFCRDPELWIGSQQFDSIYRNFQTVWLSYGGAERHPCIKPNLDMSLWNPKGSSQGTSCEAMREKGLDEAIWEEFYDRSADAAIHRLEEALWIGITERMEEASCLLLFTLGKHYLPLSNDRYKKPRPISVWNETSIEKALGLERADWRVFEAANDILDLRLWTAREMLKDAEMHYSKILGPCYDILAGTGDVSAAETLSDGPVQGAVGEP